LKTHLIFICELEIPRICFARKPTFGNWPSCIHHQTNGSTHANVRIKNLLNNYNSLVTNAQKDSSIEAPTPNMFSSSFGLTTLIVAIANVPAIGFSRSNMPSKEE
jgi:hypothetical protein